MTDKEFIEYLSNKPTIKGIVGEMKTWWSTAGDDSIIQMALDKILQLSEEAIPIEWIERNIPFQAFEDMMILSDMIRVWREENSAKGDTE